MLVDVEAAYKFWSWLKKEFMLEYAPMLAIGNPVLSIVEEVLVINKLEGIVLACGVV
jgi:hypothetical protein